MRETKIKSEKQSFSKRLKIIGVMGGSEDVPILTKHLGKCIAQLGHHLLTGAGEGIMKGVSKSFYEVQPRKGLVIGVIRADNIWSNNQIINSNDDNKCSTDRDKYKISKVNEYVEVPIYTHLGETSKDLNSRNHINVLTSDVVIALPGKKGTNSEVELALEYGTPVIFYLNGGCIVTSNGEKRNAEQYIKKYPARQEIIVDAVDLEAVQRAIKSFL